MPWPFSKTLWLAVAIMGVSGLWSCFAAEELVWKDASFEAMTPGLKIAGGEHLAGWEVQQTGREVVRDRLRVEVVEDKARAKSGGKCAVLSIPAETVGFEFVTLGQRTRLTAGKTYEAHVWVRWPDGPDVAPAKASATGGQRSAIVSFWARHRDGQGDFAGRDEWLFDNRWHLLSFCFRATDPALPTLVYVSLLPNQKPAATTLLVDDFDLRETAGHDEKEARRGTLTLDASFSEQKSAEISKPWFFANMGGHEIAGTVAEEKGGRLVRIAMNEATTNYESAQLWQHVSLREGTRYDVSCRLRWDNFTAGAPAPIVNFGIYHEATRTWYGPVDQLLEKTGDWRSYRFAHLPPFAGPWKLYVQLNGWGNFGRGVKISVDDFQCVPSASP